MIGANKFKEAAMWLGSKGVKSSEAVADLLKTDLHGPGLESTRAAAQRSIYNRGRRRLGYIGGGAGVMGINSMRSPNGSSSGAQGMMPQSSGGMTGAY